MKSMIVRAAMIAASTAILSCTGETAVGVDDAGQPGGPAAATDPAGRFAPADEQISHYTCSMHPSVRSDRPGKCPICSMDLVPVTREEVATGVIVIGAQRRQTIGVKVEPVTRRPLVASVRAVARVVYDETRLADVSLKVRGWVGELVVDSPGQRVERDEPLFTVYSPELYAAQEELLAAVESRGAARGGSAPERVDDLVAAARQRLRLWDVRPEQIERIERRGRPFEHLPILSPVSGYVIERNLVDGATIEPGARLYRIAALDAVWIEADVYEPDLPLVGVGDPVRITLPHAPAREIEARVAFVYPYLDTGTRTGRVRIEVDNDELVLKPGMYASVDVEHSLGARLAVAEDAILHAGRRDFVFVDLGEGRLRPKAVRLGQRAGDWVEVVEGLEEGEVVVTSGTFLIAAESRLKLDMEHWQ